MPFSLLTPSQLVAKTPAPAIVRFRYIVCPVCAAAGTFKFISNSDWNNSYGLDSHGNLLLGTSSGNVISPKAGTFTITLDLSQGQGNYAYSIN